eukprot:2492482-Lingulodinium_polyedra.AAC.1
MLPSHPGNGRPGGHLVAVDGAGASVEGDERRRVRSHGAQIAGGTRRDGNLVPCRHGAARQQHASESPALGA